MAIAYDDCFSGRHQRGNFALQKGDVLILEVSCIVIIHDHPPASASDERLSNSRKVGQELLIADGDIGIAETTQSRHSASVTAQRSPPAAAARRVHRLQVAIV